MSALEHVVSDFFKSPGSLLATAGCVIQSVEPRFTGPYVAGIACLAFYHLAKGFRVAVDGKAKIAALEARIDEQDRIIREVCRQRDELNAERKASHEAHHASAAEHRRDMRELLGVLRELKVGLPSASPASMPIGPDYIGEVGSG